MAVVITRDLYNYISLTSKSPSSTVWMLLDDGWKCFKGPRFTCPSTICEGDIDSICEEMLKLRLSCPQGPSPGWYTAYSFRAELKNPDPEKEQRATKENCHPVIRCTEYGVLFLIQWCVTNDDRPFGGEPYREPEDGAALPNFADVLRREVQWYLEHPDAEFEEQEETPVA